MTSFEHLYLTMPDPDILDFSVTYANIIYFMLKPILIGFCHLQLKRRGK